MPGTCQPAMVPTEETTITMAGAKACRDATTARLDLKQS